ncbi:MAG: 3',5'-nucleoside bisphosphate phosphatase [Pseudomonadota bacterium]
MIVFDLHCHSTASDGVLAPRDLVERAGRMGVQVLALTDHDSLAGLEEARQMAGNLGIRLIHGVEISVTWHGHTVHVVALNVDPTQPELVKGLAGNRGGRAERAVRMAHDLARLGIHGALEGAYGFADNKELIGRTHFARFLVERGVVKDVKTVFKKFLVKGKPGYVVHQWAGLGEALEWIRAAGGQSVLAHPGRYQMGKEKIRLLLEEFRILGGDAIEVVTGSHTPDQVPIFAALAAEYDLLASVGSDFHAPGEGGRELGRLQPLPAQCRPLWSVW